MTPTGSPANSIADARPTACVARATTATPPPTTKPTSAAVVVQNRRTVVSDAAPVARRSSQEVTPRYVSGTSAIPITSPTGIPSLTSSSA
jgi:hypothetical protein